MSFMIFLIITLAIMNRMPKEKRLTIFTQTEAALLREAAPLARAEEITSKASERAAKMYLMLLRMKAAQKKARITADSILKRMKERARAARSAELRMKKSAAIRTARSYGRTA